MKNENVISVRKTKKDVNAPTVFAKLKAKLCNFSHKPLL